MSLTDGVKIQLMNFMTEKVVTKRIFCKTLFQFVFCWNPYVFWPPTEFWLFCVCSLWLKKCWRLAKWFENFVSHPNFFCKEETFPLQISPLTLIKTWGFKIQNSNLLEPPSLLTMKGIFIWMEMQIPWEESHFIHTQSYITVTAR